MRLQPPPQRAVLDAFAVGVMLLLCTIWGVQQVASKVSLTQGIPPITQAVFRSAVAGPLVIAWLALRQGRRGLARLFAADGTLWPGLLTALLFGSDFILLFEGIQRSAASRAV